MLTNIEAIGLVAGAVVTSATGLLTFFLKRLIGRIDDNEKAFEKSVAELKNDVNGVGAKLQSAQLHSANTFVTKNELRDSLGDLLTRFDSRLTEQKSDMDAMRRELRDDFVKTWEMINKKADK